MMLSGLLWKTCIIYIDDVIIFGNNFDEHMKNVEEVLRRMRMFNVIAKLKKCVFCKREVTYLVTKVGGGKLRMDDHNKNKILKMEEPKTAKELRSFICLAGYYRCFIKEFARIAEPINGYLAKIAEERAKNRGEANLSCQKR